MPASERSAIGIDIGGTNTRAARVTSGGTIQGQRRIPSRRDAEGMLADCLSLIEALRTPDVQAIGIGVPGQVDAETGEVFSGGYVDLSSIPFARQITEATGLPVTIENDGAMALLGEHAFGAARGHDNVVLLAIGTGIGGAILERGRLQRGRRSAGQLGHIVVQPNGLPCLCGKQGCVETTSSGTALRQAMAAAGLSEGTRASDLLDRSLDTGARAILTTWAAPLRRAIDSLVAALDPEAVVLAGGLGSEAAAALDLLPPTKGWFGVPVRPALLGDVAGMIGAAVAAFQALGPGKRVLLVNGVPASGKSTVARALSNTLGWPLLALDTVKQPFLDELPPGDRLFNRMLGRASYRAILDTLREAPPGSSFVLDAWFGFQPLEILTEGLHAAGIDKVAELWCEAPPEEIGRRYASRVTTRGPGHPGLDYVPELIALAARATPTGIAPALRLDTTQPLDLAATAAWVGDRLKEPSQAP